MHEDRRVAVEDDPALPIAGFSILRRLDGAGGEETNQEQQYVGYGPDTGARRASDWNVESGVRRRIHGSSGPSNTAI